MLFLEKIAPSRVTHARVCCEDSAQRKTNKMASEITFVGDELIQFLSSVSLPNLRQALGENFLDSDSGYEDYTSDSDDGSENNWLYHTKLTLVYLYSLWLYLCSLEQLQTFRHKTDAM